MGVVKLAWGGPSGESGRDVLSWPVIKMVCVAVVWAWSRVFMRLIEEATIVASRSGRHVRVLSAKSSADGSRYWLPRGSVRVMFWLTVAAMFCVHCWCSRSGGCSSTDGANVSPERVRRRRADNRALKRQEKEVRCRCIETEAWVWRTAKLAKPTAYLTLLTRDHGGSTRRRERRAPYQIAFRRPARTVHARVDCSSRKVVRLTWSPKPNRSPRMVSDLRRFSRRIRPRT